MRKPIFWIFFIMMSLCGIIFALKNFDKASPIVTLDLRMDRHQALQSARDLAQKFNWGLKDYRQAVSFDVDSYTKDFIELEGGGTEAFTNMIANGLYQPYIWNVRNFKENETKETLIRFTPKGQPYGFVETLPESEAGMSLPVSKARIIAVEASIHQWHVDMTAYKEIEASNILQPSGRLDHIFVFERINQHLKKGNYRLKLVVSGDRFTELTHFVNIPEAFSRRFEEMRSANKTISVISNISYKIMFIIGICGVFFLMPHWILWRKALIWGVFIALLGILQFFNQLPLEWINYDTAISEQSFLWQQTAAIFYNFFEEGCIIILTFIIAESLTAKAFPHHIKLWNLWSSDVANSNSVLGRTISGYLLLGLELAYYIAFYLFTTKVLKWWTPLSTHENPNILANYIPWLSPISDSLNAGFWEECMFRAAPIAGAALIGQRFGRRRVWIVTAFILQALIFGAGHASYSQQPAYARLVELIIPSISYGLIYLYFGLLPVIICHYSYDVVFYSLPLFVSKAQGAWIDQGMVIIMAMVPLLVVIVSRYRRECWMQLKEEHYNQTRYPSVKEEPKTSVSILPETMTIAKKTGRIILISGILGFVLWIFTAEFQNYAPSQTIRRNQAIELARKIFIKQGIELNQSWKVLCTVTSLPEQSDRFIWQSGSKKIYHVLLGTYLQPPLWKIRFVHFEGAVERRAEEYIAFITIDGNVCGMNHLLPETEPGKNLTEDQASTIVNQALISYYNLEPEKLKKIITTPSKLPARTDWRFIFNDTKNSLLNKDEARIFVKIAGDKLVGIFRYIYVPEKWNRHEQNRIYMTSTIKIFSIALIFIIVVLIPIYAYKDININLKTLLGSTFLKYLILILTLKIIQFINNWPSISFEFLTTEPLINQVFSEISLNLISYIIFSGILALYVEFIQKYKVNQHPKQSYKTVLIGIAIGALISGILSLINKCSPSLEPIWADYSNINNYLPYINANFYTIILQIFVSSIMLLVFLTISRLIRYGRNKVFSFVIIILTIMALLGSNVMSVSYWLLASLVIAIILWIMYQAVFRYHLSLTPIAVGTFFIFDSLEQGVMNPYPAAVPETIFIIISICLLSFYWFRKLADKNLSL